MSKISTLRLLPIALIAGIIGAVSVVIFLNSIEEKYRLAAEPEPVKMIRVIVPRQNMRAGDRILEKNLAARQIPEKFAPAYVLLAKDVKAIVDRTLLTDVQRGRPMTQYAVTQTKSTRFSDTIELGKRARSVKVSKVESFDGLLRPGDTIDLMGTYQMQNLFQTFSSATPAKSLAETVSTRAVMPVLQNVLVIEVARVDRNGRRYEKNTDKDSRDGVDLDFTLITLELTPQQVARVELAENTGDVFAILRNIEDTSVANFSMLGTETLLLPDAAPKIDLVLDADGTPIGTIVGDKVLDDAGNVIGKVVEGEPVGLDGKRLGRIVTGVSEDDPINRVAEVADVIRDVNGDIVGRVVNGTVIDRAGNIIGSVEDGVPVGVNGQPLGNIDRGVKLDVDGNEVELSGSSVRQDIVLDAQGKPIGRVVGDNVVNQRGEVVGKIVDGQAVSLSGRQLGRVVRDVAADDPVMSVTEIADVVRDAEGNIVGKIVGDQILDRNGKVVGEVVDGEPVGLAGESLGSIDRRVALNAAGTEVALDESVLSDRAVRRETVVRDSDGAVVGRVIDGKVVDGEGNVVGSVDSRGIVRDLNGKTLGRPEEVNVNGSGEIVDGPSTIVRDSQGNVVGRVHEGKVFDASGNVIGRVNDRGEAIGGDGTSLGSVESVLTDATGRVVATEAEVVRDADGNVVGRVSNGKVVDADGKVIGEINDRGEPVSLTGQTLGSIERVMVDEEGEVVATATSVVRDADGNVIGQIKAGQIIDSNGNRIGTINESGQAVDLAGNVIGDVDTVMTDENGNAVLTEPPDSIAVVRDADGQIIGKLVDGKIYDDAGQEIGELRGGAIVSSAGDIIAAGVTVDNTDAATVDRELMQGGTDAQYVVPKIVDFIGGGTGKDGIITVQKVPLQ